MEFNEILAQSLGILAMMFNIASYQCKKQKWIIAIQFFGGALFAANYFMLGAMVGGMLNVIGTIRAIVYLFKEKIKNHRIGFLIGFIVSYIIIYVLSFVAFGKEATAFNLIVEILPVIGMTALNIGFSLKNASDVRRYALISSPCWLIYNIVTGSWGAIACEILTLSSIVIGIFRHDKQK